jgi:hypothetical protein
MSADSTMNVLRLTQRRRSRILCPTPLRIHRLVPRRCSFAIPHRQCHYAPQEACPTGIDASITLRATTPCRSTVVCQSGWRMSGVLAKNRRRHAVSAAASNPHRWWLFRQLLEHPSPFVPQPPAGTGRYGTREGFCHQQGDLPRRMWDAWRRRGGECAEGAPMCSERALGCSAQAIRLQPHRQLSATTQQRRSGTTPQCCGALSRRTAGGDQTRFAGRRRLTQCRSGLSSMPLESRAIASTVPVTELRRKRMLFFPLSSAALTTVSSSPGTVTRVPAVM